MNLKEQLYVVGLQENKCVHAQALIGKQKYCCAKGIVMCQIVSLLIQMLSGQSSLEVQKTANWIAQCESEKQNEEQLICAVLIKKDSATKAPEPEPFVVLLIRYSELIIR